MTRRVLPRLPEPRLPLREELDALARHYRHLQNEHKRTPPEGRFRRRTEDQLLDVRSDFSERFDAPPEALQALADFLEGDDEPPPWQFARALLADGIIDSRFAVTARGRRALHTLERGGR